MNRPPDFGPRSRAVGAWAAPNRNTGALQAPAAATRSRASLPAVGLAASVSRRSRS